MLLFRVQAEFGMIVALCLEDSNGAAGLNGSASGPILSAKLYGHTTSHTLSRKST
jgi:hypothetical protein